MGARLIDASKGFRPVYSIFQHEYLGCLMSAHVVQELDNGRLSLRHQGLNPDSMEQFGHKLNDTDRELITLLRKLDPNKILKKFAPKARNENEFFTKHFKDETRKTILNYVNRIMAQAIPMLEGKEVFTMGNDGYPARTEVKLLQDKAHIIFRFKRWERVAQYYPKITLRGEEIRLDKSREGAVLCDEPAWMLVDNEIFTFDIDVEGKKLRPFLKKDRISIPKSTEEQYFRKFVPRIIERYEVQAEGFEIRDIREAAHFRFIVDGSGGDNVSMEMRVRYGKHELPLDTSEPLKALFHSKGDDFSFSLIHRDMEAERDMEAFLSGLTGGRGLFAWNFMSREEGLSWLSESVQALREAGVEIVQEKSSKPFNFDAPEIEMETRESGDWFDIRAVVKIGGFSIPFIKFRNHILRGKREFTLPDGSIAILPESWFTDYRHLVEIAEERDDDTIAIRKYQAIVLEMPQNGKGTVRSRLAGMTNVEDVGDARLPEGLHAELRGYQKKGYDWLGFLREYQFGGILADDMGLGKTLQALSLLQREKESGATNASLIVMPTSLVYNWLAEAERFTPQLRALVHTGVNRRREAAIFSEYDLIITTYGIVRQDLEILKEFPFHYIILDESQMIKNPASKTARAVRQLKGMHRLSLTGTPLENSLMDLWSQMSFVNPGLLGSETFFRDFYAQPIEKQQDASRKAQLKKLIHPFILRRTKEQVASELPPKIEHLHYCEMTDEQEKIYEETRNAYRNYLMNVGDAEFKKKKLNILTGLQKLRQIAIHPGLVEEGDGAGLIASGKFKEFMRLLDVVLEKNAKVLVFSQFVRLLQMLKGEFDKKGVDYCYLDGGTRDRQGEVKRFQNDPEVPVFLISLKAGGVGLNLTAAEYVFILDPWWNPAVESQAIDRSHRIGQQNTVFSYKFITRGSIEEKIIKLQERKAKLSREIVSVEEDVFKRLDLQDLRELIS